MNAENGFDANAVYVGDYLNGSGDDGYLGITVLTRDQSNMLTTVTTADDTVTTGFRLLEGIDTNEVSVDGLNSVAQTASYEMTIAGVKKQIGPTDIKELTSASVAEAMISKFRPMRRLRRSWVSLQRRNQVTRFISPLKVRHMCNH